MRHLVFTGALAAALVTSPAAAQTSKQQGGQSADPHPAEQKQDSKNIKGYGYGEQPGAQSNGGSEQSAEPSRPRSSAPQDERRSSARQGARVAGPAAGETARSISGRVVAATDKSLSVRGSDRRVRKLRVDEKTRVMREGHEVAVSDLQRGEDVRASFATRGGRRVATTITLIEKGAREPPPHTDKGRESDVRQREEQPRSER